MKKPDIKKAERKKMEDNLKESMLAVLGMVENPEDMAEWMEEMDDQNTRKTDIKNP